MSDSYQGGNKSELEDVAETRPDKNLTPYTSKRGVKRKFQEEQVNSGHGTDDKEPTPVTDLHCIKYASGSTFPPTVMEWGNSLEEIIKSVSSQGIFPSEMIEAFEEDDKHTKLTLRLREFTGKDGIVLVGRSMAATCNLKNCEARPHSVICDALLISQSLPPTLLTFIEDTEDTEAVVASGAAASKDEGIEDYRGDKYNKSVAKAMMYARYFTDEPFDVIYGVITSEDTKTSKTFNGRLSNIKEETSKYSIGSNLLMSHERCLKIHKAFIMMSALSDICLSPAVGKASHYVVPVDMYPKLMLHLDSTHHRTTVSNSDKSFDLLLNERLSKTGQRMEDTFLGETSMAGREAAACQIPKVHPENTRHAGLAVAGGGSPTSLFSLDQRETMKRKCHNSGRRFHQSGKRLGPASPRAFLPINGVKLTLT